MYRERFVKNLNLYCKDKVISTIAKEMGMHQQTLQKYLHDECEASLENMGKIADYFGITLDELIGREI